MSRDGVPLAFAINCQQPDFILADMPIVDYTDAAALAFSRYSPANFSDTAGTTNDNPGIRPLKQERLQACIFIICQVISDKSSEDRCFYEEYVGLYYTAMPYSRSKFGFGDPGRGWVRAAVERPERGQTTGAGWPFALGGVVTWRGSDSGTRRMETGKTTGPDGLSQQGGCFPGCLAPTGLLYSSAR